MFLPNDGLISSKVLAIDTVAYSSGDVMGAPMEIESATLNTKGIATVRGVLVLDNANQKVPLTILFFDRDPGSVGANNAANTLTKAQLSMLVAMVSVANADYVTLKAATNAVASKAPNVMIQPKQSSKSVWMVVLAGGAGTFASATDLEIKVMLERQA